MLRDWGFTWELRWGFQLQTVSSATPTRKRKSSPTPSSSLNVNMGILVDYATTSSQFESPLQCVSEARRHVLGSSEHEQARKLSRVAAASTQTVASASTMHHCMTDCSYDSFDDCLQAANYMDAVLSYYYADEKESGAVKVVEIFPLHHRTSAVSAITHSAASDLSCSSLTSINDSSVSAVPS